MKRGRGQVKPNCAICKLKGRQVMYHRIVLLNTSPVSYLFLF